MKKIILLLAFCLSVGNLFAQDANADKLREEGDAAMTAKNYPEVVAKYINPAKRNVALCKNETCKNQQKRRV